MTSNKKYFCGSVTMLSCKGSALPFAIALVKLNENLKIESVYFETCQETAPSCKAEYDANQLRRGMFSRMPRKYKKPEEFSRGISQWAIVNSAGSTNYIFHRVLHNSKIDMALGDEYELPILLENEGDYAAEYSVIDMARGNAGDDFDDFWTLARNDAAHITNTKKEEVIKLMIFQQIYHEFMREQWKEGNPLYDAVHAGLTYLLCLLRLGITLP